MKHLIFSILVMLVSTASYAAAEDTAVFQRAMATVSPPAAEALSAVTKDYMAKCNVGEPSVAQLKSLTQTEAYSFRMAAKSMGASEAEWSSEARARYASYLKNLDCDEVR